MNPNNFNSKPSLEVPRDLFGSWKKFGAPGVTPRAPTEGPLEVQREFLKNLMIKGILGINSTQFSALKINTKLLKL